MLTGKELETLRELIRIHKRLLPRLLPNSRTQFKCAEELALLEKLYEHHKQECPARRHDERE